MLHRLLFVKNSYTNFHENPRDCSVIDTHVLHIKHSALLHKEYLKHDLIAGIKVTIMFYLVGLVGIFMIFVLCFLVFLMMLSFISHFTVCVIFFSLAPKKQPLDVALYYPIFLTF
jgi:hypothetical protein